jgi:hypothetical protein
MTYLTQMTCNIFFLEYYLNNIQTLILKIPKILMSFLSFPDILLTYSQKILSPHFPFFPAACLPASPVCNRQRQGYICMLFSLIVLKSVSICGKIRFFRVQSSLLDSCFGRAFFSILYKPNIEYFHKN